MCSRDFVCRTAPPLPRPFLCRIQGCTKKHSIKVLVQSLERALEPLRDDPRVGRLHTAHVDDPADAEMISRDGKRAPMVVELEDGGHAEVQDAYAALRKEVRSDSLEVLAAGRIPLN